MWLDQHVAGDRKTVVLPYGLSQSRRDEFDAMGRRAGIRLAAQEITFIGTWSLRKGAADWPEIWSQIRHERPAARLRLLGVGNRSVLHDAEVIGGYKSDELPSLLSHGTVGAFPSYVEGFPFAVLEQLAAGIPVVAYDSPGARETLRQLEPSLLVPPGDTERLARRILDILALDGNDYALLAEACRTLADQYLWPDIASQTADIYRSELARIRNR
jgi:glycosyltransferase involved in cell wall biosynthesis